MNVKFILDMSLTNHFSSSGLLYKQLTVFHHPSYEESSRWHDTNDDILLMMNNYLFETCREKFKWKRLLKKSAQLFGLFLTCLYNDARLKNVKFVESVCMLAGCKYNIALPLHLLQQITIIWTLSNVVRKPKLLKWCESVLKYTKLPFLL